MRHLCAKIEKCRENQVNHMTLVMDIIWPMSQSHFHVSFLYSLK